MSEPEFVCCDCDKIFSLSAAVMIPHVEKLCCPLCGSDDIERISDRVVRILSDMHALDAEHHDL